jgi:hypothetical protein
MADRLQQQTLSFRISEALRDRLERAKQLLISKTGNAVTTSDVAKQFLESAREDRLEVVDLMANPTERLIEIRHKVESQRVLSRPEWIMLAYFIQQGLEAFSSDTPTMVSRESFVAALDAFLAAYELRRGPSVLDYFYVSNLPGDFLPVGGAEVSRSGSVMPDVVKKAVKEIRRELSNPTKKTLPMLAGRNLFVLLEEENIGGGEKLHRALLPHWEPLWKLAARGHYYMSKQPIREKPRPLEERFNREAIPPVSVERFTLSFARGEGNDFSVLITFPGIRGPLYPIGSYPAMSEFRRMLETLDAEGKERYWKGEHFFAYVMDGEKEKDIGFRARDNGITLTLTGKEWKAMRELFHRAWQLPEVREMWEGLILEYGEL